MTTIAALMSFYDDPADTAERAIRSVEGLATHLIAVDGAYASFPSGERRSPQPIRDAIERTADDCGMDLLFYTPADVWTGGEVEKRDRMFRFAGTTGADWFTILDTDFRFEYPEGREAVIDALDHAHGYEVAEVTLIDYLRDPETDTRERLEHPLPLFYRAAGLAPIRIGPTHYHTRREGSGTFLWGCGLTPVVPRADLKDVVHVQHEWWFRDEHRRAQKWTYYFQRDGAGIEHNPFARHREEAK